jgi:rhamnogalacturonan endolyase
MKPRTLVAALFSLALTALPSVAQPQAENLSRALVATRTPEGKVFVTWRLLPTDAKGAGFNVYRQDGETTPEKLNSEPLTGATSFMDDAAPKGVDYAGTDVSEEIERAAADSLKYSIRSVIAGAEQGPSTEASVWERGYLKIPIQPIEGYRPGDASVGDLDGDGELDIVIHLAGRGNDNSFAGVTDEPILDAYKMDGTHLWRINLGKNIREGEHYTQFMVYDLDGDGRAEVACKTADGTTDGAGKVIGDATKDWRTLREGSQRNGRILEGPEFLTIFDGRTGAALKTVDYIPTRDPIDGWGGIGGNAGNDSYGNRCDRFLACVAYLDGERPSLVMCRGVYGRIVMAAWDWRDGELTKRWVFDSGSSDEPYDDASPFSGMGGHSLAVADVDEDGRDEIVYQSMVVDDNGQGLYSTGLRHGDAMYVTDMYPDRPGQEVFTVHENEENAERFQTPGAAMRDARTGEILWKHSPTVDVGSGMAADIDPAHPGFEAWGGPGGLRDAKGESIGPAPRNSGWGIWWDGDPLRELLETGRGGRGGGRGRGRGPGGNAAPGGNSGPAVTGGSAGPGAANAGQGGGRNSGGRRGGFPGFGPRPTTVSKWNPATGQSDEIASLEGVSFSRGPCIAGDLLGDWREELLVVAPDGQSLRLYTTTIPTDLRITTLLADRQYRLGLVWQNVVYNKPCYPSFYLGDGMTPR